MATNRLPRVTARESESIAETSRGTPSTEPAGAAPGRVTPACGSPAAASSVESGRAEPACCTVAVYGRVGAFMPGKKQKGTALSLADALTATRSAHRRVLALVARLEATERTILAAMASAAAPHPAAAAAKRPVGRPRTRPVAAIAPAARAPRRSSASSTASKRPVGRPKG
jgi:hypothetical protein